jgi:hypothetical protein
MMRGGKATLLFREGETPPGWDRPETLYANGNYGTPAMRLTAAGRVAWITQTRTGSSPPDVVRSMNGGMAICLHADGVSMAVLRTGQHVEGLPEKGVSNSFYHLAVNDTGQMVVLAGMAKGGAVMARRSSGAWLTLVATGDRIDVPGLGARVVGDVSLVSGTGGETLAPTSLGPAGVVVYKVTFETLAGAEGKLPDTAIFAQQLD